MKSDWNLSPRELDVIEAAVAANGTATAKVLGQTLGISPKTVDIHWSNLQNKMGALTRAEAMLMWDRQRRGAPVRIPPADYQPPPLKHPSETSLLRDFNTCPTCRGLGFVRKAA